ncbi:hypothetical protein O0I10_000639 [Lichtheimia ornata]|uniref:Peptidase S8/S53 domain-containing protein n=1 Tax=Lichtheimia ornata TaxID=688661 RepID=A0AAD7Y413_9FUNG|nr:uncharacterized protein O0I10_000639 [Lichtheimia ornata]KAJ8663400.1 hypothetical protein O0I10_000639 [Lichtheimia ornata]
MSRLQDTVAGPRPPDAVVAQRIAAKGMPVVGAVGNEGEQGAMTMSAPSGGHGVTSAVSMDTLSWRLGYDEWDFMATPYVAGAVSLYLKQAHKDHDLSTKPKFTTEQFQHYAYKAPNSHATGIDSPLAQGAGLIQVYDTIMQDQLKIRNMGNSTASNGYIFSEPVTYIDNAKASIRFSQKTIKLAPGKSATIEVTLTPPKTNPYDHIVYGAYIQFKRKVQATRISLYPISVLLVNNTKYPSSCLDPLW